MDAYTISKLAREAGVSVHIVRDYLVRGPPQWLARHACKLKRRATMHSDATSGVLSPPPRWRGYTWGVLAVLTCPCHLPLLAAVFAGTSAGAFVSDHLGVAALALTGLFVLSVTRVLRVFGRKD